jgi:hypothetical protein
VNVTIENIKNKNLNSRWLDFAQAAVLVFSIIGQTHINTIGWYWEKMLFVEGHF